MSIVSKFFGAAVALWGNALFSDSIPWAIDYSSKVDPAEFHPFSVVVLDSEAGFAVDSLREEKKTVFGYLSLGQASTYRFYFDEVKDLGILIGEDSNWPGSYSIDVRSKEWAALVINELVPRILRKKFDGIFIDTVDQIVDLEEQDPEKYKGMKEAAVNIIRGIKRNFPEAKLMMNRGYGILKEVAGVLDIELGESVYTTYDFKEKKYRFASESDYSWQVDRLNEGRKSNPKIALFTLDYWYPEDKETIKKIYKVERDNGFSPYVSTIDLQTVIPEPK